MRKVVLRGVVSGKVQGVWFRRFVATHAEQLGVTGYAKNLRDGSVEVLLVGDSVAVKKLKGYVAVGPSAAQVVKVHWETLPTAVDYGIFQVL